MILFRNSKISYKVAVESKVPAFTFGQILHGINGTELDKMIQAAYTTPSANRHAMLSGQHNKSIKDDNNNQELYNERFVSESNRLQETPADLLEMEVEEADLLDYEQLEEEGAAVNTFRFVMDDEPVEVRKKKRRRQSLYPVLSI